MVLVPKQMRMHTRTHAQMRMHTPSPLCIRTAMPTTFVTEALLRHVVIYATAADVRSKATDRDY